MNCPYCKIDLEDKIDYDNKTDHTMKCFRCNKEIEVTYDTYTEEHDGNGVDIFELNKKDTI